MKILGIDPGTVYTGYALLHQSNQSFAPQVYDRIQVPQNKPFPERLQFIHAKMSAIIEQFQPDVMAVEDVYVNVNAKTSLKLGHARGVILLAGAQAGLPVEEYAPREIKQAVVGNGNATKDQIMWMVKRLLNIQSDKLAPDAADALAIALCCGMRRKLKALGVK